ncbi:ORF6C domain-containing protein [Paenibacillus antarcticus]|uniref:ORF6C domain-containing protein n=1 Tax=Paenibacillus antarcticus TaxID=253703 RepID=A0A168PAM3_9BACL|nr:ORF6C domain-containing protein [Paenibacillus antarcticus]OAB46570.1 hypothetical protein PBAT_11180 [Paenibacillus antarcticus]
MSKSDALIESKSLRESVIDRSEVLDKVKKLSLLPDDVNASIDQVTAYYEVGKEAINSLIKDNREELESDGLKVLTGMELTKFAKSFEDIAIIGKMTRSLTIIPRRAILRIGMLLRDSLIARGVRDYLLNREANPYSGLSPEVRAIFVMDDKVQKLDTRIETLENKTTIDYGQQQRLKKAGNAKAISVLGGKKSAAYQNSSVRSKVYQAMWNDYQEYFDTNSYSNTFTKDYEQGLQYVPHWTPPNNLMREIERENGQTLF